MLRIWNHRTQQTRSLGRVSPHGFGHPKPPRVECLEDRTLPSFAAPVFYPTGRTPEAVTTTDLNRDGKLDLVAANASDFTVSSLLGNGDGTFQRALTQRVGGGYPDAIAVGDFDGDGYPDVVVTNNNDNTVSVLLGRGDGTFFAPTTYGVGTQPGSVVVADFNGDGIVDIAVGNSYSPNVSILLGRGDGSFQPARTVDTGGNVNSLAVGDFHHDGKQDLAVGLGNRVGILQGNGDGTFQPPVTYSVQGSINMLAVDLNNDGNLDLVTTTNSNSNSVDVLLGNADGTFGPMQAYPAGPFTRGLAVANFTGNGNQDIVVTNPTNNTLNFLRGRGDGSFLPPVEFSPGPEGSGPLGLSVGDFNGDGAPDLVATSIGGGGVSVFLNTSAVPTYLDMTAPPDVPAGATFQVTVTARNQFGGVSPDYRGTVGLTVTDPGALVPPAYTYTAADNGVHSFTVILQDTDTQYITAHDDAAGFSATVGIFVRGPRLFNPARTYGGATSPYAVVTADFNGDGILDLATANSNTSADVSVYLGNGDGTFQSAARYPIDIHGANALAVADVNNDGIPDLLLPVINGNVVSVLLGNGDGTFRPYINSPTGSSPATVAVGDFNGDGNLDLVTANYLGGDVTVLLGNGDGTFQPPVHYPVGQFPSTVAVASLSGNGILDLVVSNAGSDTVSVLMGNGDGTFQPAVDYQVGHQPGAVIVGDFNRDGVPDVAVANDLGGTVSILLGNGDGTLQPAVNYDTGPRPYALVAADFQGTGNLDLAVANGPLTYDTVSVLRGNGDGTFQARETFVVGAFPTGLAAGDFNGDGRPDLAASVFYSNGVAVMLNARP